MTLERGPLNQSSKASSLEKQFVLNEKEKAVIEELEQPIIHIVERLSDHIEAGDYSLILGDDASGRIPTIMVAKIIQAIYKHNGRTTPLVRFLAGGKGLDLKNEENKEHALSLHIGRMLETMKKEKIPPGKCLIVTDTLHSGETVQSFANALEENDMGFEVASVGTTGSKAEEYEKLWNTRVAIGMQVVPTIDSRTDATARALKGVDKNREDLFAIPGLKEEEPIASAARIYAKEIAAKIAKQYIEKHEQ